MRFIVRTPDSERPGGKEMKDVNESAMNGVNGSSKRKKGSDLCVIIVKIVKIRMSFI